MATVTCYKVTHSLFKAHFVGAREYFAKGGIANIYSCKNARHASELKMLTSKCSDSKHECTHSLFILAFYLAYSRFETTCMERRSAVRHKQYKDYRNLGGSANITHT